MNSWVDLFVFSLAWLVFCLTKFPPINIVKPEKWPTWVWAADQTLCTEAPRNRTCGTFLSMNEPTQKPIYKIQNYDQWSWTNLGKFSQSKEKMVKLKVYDRGLPEYFTWVPSLSCVQQKRYPWGPDSQIHDLPYL